MHAATIRRKSKLLSCLARVDIGFIWAKSNFFNYGFDASLYPTLRFPMSEGGAVIWLRFLFLLARFVERVVEKFGAQGLCLPAFVACAMIQPVSTRDAFRARKRPHGIEKAVRDGFNFKACFSTQCQDKNPKASVLNAEAARPATKGIVFAVNAMIVCCIGNA